MEQGHWFMSLYNDDIDSQEVSFVLRVSQELTKNCPSGCNGRGQCILGHCQCEAGYDGPDCGQSKFFHIYYVLKIIGMWMWIRSGFWEVLCFWDEKSWPKIVPAAVTGGDNVFWDTANAKPDMMDQTVDKVSFFIFITFWRLLGCECELGLDFGRFCVFEMRKVDKKLSQRL